MALRRFGFAAEKFGPFDLNAIKSYFSNTKADASDDWHLDDPFVFLGEFLNYAITAVRHRSFNAARRVC